MPYFMKEQGIGKDRMYSMIDEAIEAGYMQRTETLEGGLKRYHYLVSEFPKFKNCLPCPGFPDTGKQDTENPHPTKEQSSSSLHSEEEKKEQHNKRSDAPPPSADAVFLCDFFLKKIKERNPEFKEPNIKKWEASMDRLLRIDKRDPQITVELIIWASTHNFWKAGCLSPEKLRSSYDAMRAQMDAGSEKEKIRLNRSYAIYMKGQYPEELKDMFFDEKFVYNRKSGSELALHMDQETFKEAFFKLFGGNRVQG
jgi:hypothetical protein